MPRLLIAGYGFLGQAIKSRFCADGWSVDSLNRSGSEGAMVCDLSDRSSVQRWQGDYDLIIHCAASGGGGADAYRLVYYQACHHLLSRFEGVPLLFTSSTSVYAQRDHRDVDEQSVAEPLAETAKVLRQTEDLVLAHGGAVLRLSALCGAGRCHTASRFLSGQARMDAPLGDAPAGRRMMNFIHRHDAAKAFQLLAQNGKEAAGQVYNVSAVTLSQLNCYQLLAEHYQMPMPEVAGTHGSPQVKRSRALTSKRVIADKIKALGWQPDYADLLAIALDPHR